MSNLLKFLTKDNMSAMDSFNSARYLKRIFNLSVEGLTVFNSIDSIISSNKLKYEVGKAFIKDYKQLLK